MHLSAPIYLLKRKAKRMARQTGAPLHKALDKLAVDEGFRSWSHLASSSQNKGPAKTILSVLRPGDLVLLGARPGHGKTLLGLELASKSSGLGRRGFFFTLDYHERDVADRMATLGIDKVTTQRAMVVDTSDDVSADHIIDRLRGEKGPALVVIDYLQLLDQKRTNPSLEDQIKSLRSYVQDTGAICAVISQIDRSFDMAGKAMPDISDIRLPNPLDLSAFSKFFFLHNGKIQMDQAA